MTKEELLHSFTEKVEARIPLRLALDDGELVFTAGRVYFIALRLGQWDVVEEWERSSVSRWTLTDSFMGQELAIFTPNGRFLFRKVPEEVDWATLFSASESLNKKSSSSTPAQEHQATQEELVSVPYSYQESASEMIDMLSKHTERAAVEPAQSLSELLKQKKSRRQEMAASQSGQGTREQKMTVPEIAEPKKKKGCGGCFNIIFWFVFISMFFSGFFTSFLSSF